jgi:nucleotide-binding universal stress UspA family protein
MSKTVLVPLDGSPLSYRALRHAFEQFPDSDVIVLHVNDIFEPGWHGTDSIHEPMVGTDEWHAVADEVTEEMFDRAREMASEYDTEITTESDIGDPERIIPDYTREEDVDHVVLGVHGREEENRSIFGRVAESVVFRAATPVTVIR